MPILLAGIGTNMFIVSANAMIAQYFEEKRGKANALATSVNGVGAMVLGPLILYMSHEYGYSGTFLILGGCMLHLCISGALYRPLPTIHIVEIEMIPQAGNTNSSDILEAKSENKNCSMDSEAGIEKQHMQITETYHQDEKLTKDNSEPIKVNRCVKVFKKLGSYFGVYLFRNLTFVSLCFLLMFVYMTFDICITFMSASVRDVGFTDGNVTVLIILTNSMDIPARLLSGIIFDLPTIRDNRTRTYSIMTLIKAITVICIPFMPGLIGRLTVWSVFAAIRGAVQCQTSVVVASVVGRKNITSAIGLTRFCQGIGMLIGPPVGGK